MAASTNENTVTINMNRPRNEEENPTCLVHQDDIDDDTLRKQLSSLLKLSKDSKLKKKRLQHHIALIKSELKAADITDKHVDRTLHEVYVKILKTRQEERHQRQCPVCLTHVPHDSKEVGVVKESYHLLHPRCLQVWTKHQSLHCESDNAVVSGPAAYMTSTFHRFLKY